MALRQHDSGHSLSAPSPRVARPLSIFKKSVAALPSISPDSFSYSLFSLGATTFRLKSFLIYSITYQIFLILI